MNTLAERFGAALNHARISSPHKNKIGLAKACNVRPSTVTSWFNGDTKVVGSESAIKAATYLGVSSNWLISGVGEMVSQPMFVYDDHQTVDENEYVLIPEYRVSCSAGNGCTLYFEELTDAVKVPYKRSWFQQRQINPEDCKRFAVHGTSMEPVIWDGDIILVDTAPQRIIAGKIYAFMMGEEMRVKRLYPLLNGSLKVQSINPEVPEETLTQDDLPTFALIGRVRDRTGDSMF